MQMTNTFEVARYGAELQGRIHQMPIGDPLSGPAYGEMLKSKGLGMVLGVVAAVGTMGAAAPMLAVGASLASQIAGGVMMAGGVMSGVGAVTENKKLAKIGGILSLAGGVGGLAISATGGTSGVLGQSLGSGSEAVSKMAGSFMESVNSVGSSVGLGDIYSQSSISGGVPSGGGTPGDAPAAGEFGPLSDADPNASGLMNKAEAGQLGAPSTDAGALNLTNTDTSIGNTFKMGSTGPTQTSGEISVTGGSQIDPANLSNTPAPGWGEAPATAGGTTPPAVGESATEKAARIAKEEAAKKAAEGNFMGMNKTELMKVGARMLEKAAAAGFAPDESEKIDALIKTHGAQAAKYNSATEVEQYQLANSKKQVVMISANDPQMDAKVREAAAKGHEVAFIPTIGTGGVKPTGPGIYGTAQQMAAVQPVRQGVFNKATA